MRSPPPIVYLKGVGVHEKGALWERSVTAASASAPAATRAFWKESCRRSPRLGRRLPARPPAPGSPWGSRGGCGRAPATSQAGTLTFDSLVS